VVFIDTLQAVMTPLYFTLENSRSLKIIPETRVILDGHPIISYNYSIFLNDGKITPANATAKPGDIDANDPNYLGYITFEKPGQLFNYTAVQGYALNATEVEEVIEYLSHVRDNPQLWRLPDDV
jgi:hypothetical protein